jgi:hypothetical protein
VVVGYQRVADAGSGGLRFWRHDGIAGPYIAVESSWREPDRENQPWLAALLPLLPKIYVSAERAEAAGRFWFSQYADSDRGAAGLIRAARDRGDLTFRTYAISSSRYKEGLAGRGIDADLAQLYRFAHLPKYIWVVEAVDRRERGRSERRPDVLGEVILDATSNALTRSFETGLLAFHGDDYAYRIGPDYGQSRHASLRGRHYLSGRPCGASPIRTAVTRRKGDRARSRLAPAETHADARNPA